MQENALREQLIARRTALRLTQKDAAAKSGISYGSYIVAETYGRMGFKIRTQVIAWLTAPIDSLMEKGGAPHGYKEKQKARRRAHAATGRSSQ